MAEVINRDGMRDLICDWLEQKPIVETTTDKLFVKGTDYGTINHILQRILFTAGMYGYELKARIENKVIFTLCNIFENL